MVVHVPKREDLLLDSEFFSKNQLKVTFLIVFVLFSDIM